METIERIPLAVKDNPVFVGDVTSAKSGVASRRMARNAFALLAGLRMDGQTTLPSSLLTWLSHVY